MDNGRCRKHGGAAPVGIALPQTTHAKYSKALPPRLRESYEAALEDDGLIQLGHEIAVCEANVIDALKRLDAGESGATIRRISGAFDDLEAAIRRRDTDDMNAALSALRRHIRGAKEDVAARAEVQGWMEQKRRLSETERKHLIDLGQMVRADQLMAIVSALSTAVRANVSDPEALRRISRDIAAILNIYQDGAA